MTQNTRMKLGITVGIGEGSLQGRTPTFRDIQAMAQAAEQAGFDSLWVADHLIYRFPGQEEKSFRSPALLAKMADTLDEISGGRFILGLGAGWHQPEYEAFGYPFDHLASRFEEALQVIAPLLREGKVDFQGRYYQVHNCVLRPRGPSHAGPPILIGAHRPRMLQIVAHYADAWNTAWHVDPAVVKQGYEELKEACAVVGRDPAAIELTAGTVVSLQPGENAAPERVISGSPEEIASRLQGFADVGVAHLIVILDPLSVSHIEQFGRIVELLRKR